MQKQSDYKAKVVTTEQMIRILAELDWPETRLEWTLALVHAALGLFGPRSVLLFSGRISSTRKVKISRGAPGVKAKRRPPRPKGL
jgi:hypothetical protein